MERTKHICQKCGKEFVSMIQDPILCFDCDDIAIRKEVESMMYDDVDALGRPDAAPVACPAYYYLVDHDDEDHDLNEDDLPF